MKPMSVAVLSAKVNEQYYKKLDETLNNLIETSQCFLFNILCGYVRGLASSQETLGEKWARRRGAPILYISENSKESLLRTLFSKADYIIFLVDGNPFINKALMQYKMMGKHGSVIYIQKE